MFENNQLHTLNTSFLHCNSEIETYMQVKRNCEARLWVIPTELLIFNYRHQLVDVQLMHLKYFKAPTNLISKIKNVSGMHSGCILRLSFGQTFHCYFHLLFFSPIFLPSSSIHSHSQSQQCREVGHAAQNLISMHSISSSIYLLLPERYFAIS